MSSDFGARRADPRGAHDAVLQPGVDQVLLSPTKPVQDASEGVGDLEPGRVPAPIARPSVRMEEMSTTRRTVLLRRAASTKCTTPSLSTALRADAYLERVPWDLNPRTRRPSPRRRISSKAPGRPRASSRRSRALSRRRLCPTKEASSLSPRTARRRRRRRPPHTKDSSTTRRPVSPSRPPPARSSRLLRRERGRGGERRGAREHGRGERGNQGLAARGGTRGRGPPPSGSCRREKAIARWQTARARARVRARARGRRSRGRRRARRRRRTRPLCSVGSGSVACAAGVRPRNPQSKASLRRKNVKPHTPAKPDLRRRRWQAGAGA